MCSPHVALSESRESELKFRSTVDLRQFDTANPPMEPSDVRAIANFFRDLNLSESGELSMFELDRWLTEGNDAMSESYLIPLLFKLVPCAREGHLSCREFVATMELLCVTSEDEFLRFIFSQLASVGIHDDAPMPPMIAYPALTIRFPEFREAEAKRTNVNAPLLQELRRLTQAHAGVSTRSKSGRRRAIGLDEARRTGEARRAHLDEPDDLIIYEEFLALHLRSGYIRYPIEFVRNRLREQCLGARFWTRRRADIDAARRARGAYVFVPKPKPVLKEDEEEEEEEGAAGDKDKEKSKDKDGAAGVANESAADDKDKGKDKSKDKDAEKADDAETSGAWRNRWIPPYQFFRDQVRPANLHHPSRAGRPTVVEGGARADGVDLDDGGLVEDDGGAGGSSRRSKAKGGGGGAAAEDGAAGARVARSVSSDSGSEEESDDSEGSDADRGSDGRGSDTDGDGRRRRRRRRSRRGERGDRGTGRVRGESDKGMDFDDDGVIEGASSKGARSAASASATSAAGVFGSPTNSAPNSARRDPGAGSSFVASGSPPGASASGVRSGSSSHLMAALHHASPEGASYSSRPQHPPHGSSADHHSSSSSSVRRPPPSEDLHGLSTLHGGSKKNVHHESHHDLMREARGDRDDDPDARVGATFPLHLGGSSSFGGAHHGASVRVAPGSAHPSATGLGAGSQHGGSSVHVTRPGPN